MGLPCSNAYPLCWGHMDDAPPPERPAPSVAAMVREVEQIAGSLVGLLVDLGELRLDLEALGANEATELGRS